jgi:hypothetical protein
MLLKDISYEYKITHYGDAIKCLILSVILSMAPYGFLVDGIENDNTPCIVVSVLLFLGILYFIFRIIENIRTVVKFTNDDIMIIKLFTKCSFKWDEITEFGRIREYVKTDEIEYYWSYYLKAKKLGDKKFVVADSSEKGVEYLLRTVLRKANNANFITLVNNAWIPYTKKYDAFPWNIKKDLPIVHPK